MRRPLKPLERTVLAGCGAIGTAITAILRELSATGSLFAVDPEVFDEPNLTTYSLGTVLDAARRSIKVDLVENALPGVHVTGVQSTVLEFLSKGVASQYVAPLLALGGLNSREARHELSRLHADLTLDGSTGGRIGTTIGLREGTWTGPCLRCYYPTGEIQSARPTVADVTGLPPHLTADGDRIVDTELLEEASPRGSRATPRAARQARLCLAGTARSRARCGGLSALGILCHAARRRDGCWIPSRPSERPPREQPCGRRGRVRRPVRLGRGRRATPTCYRHLHVPTRPRAHSRGTRAPIDPALTCLSSRYAEMLSRATM